MRSRLVRYSSKMVEDVNFDRNGSKNLVLLPAIGENPLFDNILDNEFRL